MSVIFVAGVHGVGKTTGCTHVSQSHGITHATASQIIRDGKASKVTDVRKVVKDMDQNQMVLVRGVQEIIARDKRLLLDGHFTLKTNQGIQPIPLHVFESLSLRAIAVFTDDPSKIASRISERDGMVHSVDDLKAHQELEVAHAHKISEKLGIPLAVLDAFDSPRLAKLVSNWLNL